MKLVEGGSLAGRIAERGPRTAAGGRPRSGVAG